MAAVNLYNQNIYNNSQYNGGLCLISQNPSDNIVFNNFGLQNSLYCTQYVRHESGPSRDFILSDVHRGDGRNLQRSFYKKKVITLTGTLTASSNSELLTQIDLTKKLLREENAELKIIEGSLTRVYTATCTNLQTIFAQRDYFNVDWVPYHIEFTCWTPFGRDLSRTTRDDFSQTSSTINIELTNQGTITGRLVAFINFDAENTVSKINWKNNTNSDAIEITTSFSASDVLKIDGENQEVTLNGTNVDFDGFPPTMDVGANSFTLTVTSTSHTVSVSNKFYNYYL